MSVRAISREQMQLMSHNVNFTGNVTVDKYFVTDNNVNTSDFNR